MLVIPGVNFARTDASIPKGTSQADSFPHGFGLPNIRNAAEKYGGQCSIKIENGIFTLQLIFPIP